MPTAEARARADRPSAARPAGARRTVVIRGQVAPPSVHRRRPPRRPAERIVGTRPDRAALWAVLMGVFLILTAILTAHGA